MFVSSTFSERAISQLGDHVQLPGASVTDGPVKPANWPFLVTEIFTDSQVGITLPGSAPLTLLATTGQRCRRFGIQDAVKNASNAFLAVVSKMYPRELSNKQIDRLVIASELAERRG